MMNKNHEAAFAAPKEITKARPCRWLIRVAALLCVLGWFSGCAPNIYNINMRYEPTKVIKVTVTDGRKYNLTVTSFADRRKMDDTQLIGRVIKSDGSFIPILPKYNKPTDTVTAAVRDVLTKSGYAVTPDRPSWDLSEASIRTEWGTLLISGTIDTLEVICTKKALINEYKATARVTLIFADVQNRKIFYRLASESTSSLDHPFFSEERLEGLINGVLADAVEKAIERPETDRQIRQAFKP